MRRTLVIACVVLCSGACVDLDKPESVADCAAQGTCTNSTIVEDSGTKDTAATGARDAPGDLPSPADLPPDRAADHRSDDRVTSPDVPVQSCVSDGLPKPAGTVCRPAAGPCDIAETCDGVTTDCPADELAPRSKECRPSAGACDVRETCSGQSASCPDDVVASAGTICRPSTDGNGCDPEETCTGSSTACPTDVYHARPGVPGGVSASPGTLQATISWSGVAGATDYHVKRSTTSMSGYTTVVTLPAPSASPYIDKGLASGTTYYYVVSASNTIDTCESANSPEVSVTAGGQCTPPPVPSGGLTANNANGSITVAWNAVSGAVAYTVYRSTSAKGAYAAISSNQTAVVFTDFAKDLANGTLYYYKISASNAQCTSDPSSAVSARSCMIPPVPAGVVATRTAGAQAKLAWSASTGAASYSVGRSKAKGSGYSIVATASGTSYTDTTAENSSAYYYVLTARSDASGNCSSAASDEAWVPSCAQLSVGSDGRAQVANIFTYDAYCVVTCDELGWWSAWELGNRTLYVNGIDKTSAIGSALPAKTNNGYTFYFTAGDNQYTGVNWGGSSIACQ